MSLASSARPDAASNPLPGPTPSGRTRRGARRRDIGLSYLLLAPALVLFGLFLFYPLVRAVQISLTDSTGISSGDFVGLDNYARMATDPAFWQSAGNTVLLAVVSVPLALGLGLGFAMLLHGRTRGRAVFRTIILAPVVVSGVVVAMAGRFVFDQNTGIVNQTLEAVGLPAVPWQSGGVPAMLTVLIMLTWSRVGLVAVIYLGALQNLDPHQSEAGALDGASWWQRLRWIVLPQLRPTTFFLTVILAIETFQVFDLVYVMTGGGPGRATELLVTYAYAEGFDARQQGYGTALGVVVFVVMLIATGFWWRAQRESEESA